MELNAGGFPKLPKLVKIPGLDSLVAYKDLYFAPHGWTILHLLAIFQSKEIISIVADSNFQVPFLVDNYGKTPLEYLLSRDNYEISTVTAVAKFMLDQLEDKVGPYERQLTIDSLTPRFSFLATKLNTNLIIQYLKLFYGESSPEVGFDVNSFGKPVTGYEFSETPTVGKQVYSKLYKEGQDEVSFKTLRLKWDYDTTSDDMLDFAQFIVNVENEDFLRTPAMSRLITHLWNCSWPTLAALGIYFSIMMSLISVYIGTGDRILAVEIIIMVMVAFAFVLELVQVTVLKLEYFKSLWNYIDLSLYFLVYAFIITRMKNDYDELKNGWLVASIILVGYSRWLSYLSLFEASSN